MVFKRKIPLLTRRNASPQASGCDPPSQEAFNPSRNEERDHDPLSSVTDAQAHLTSFDKHHSNASSTEKVSRGIPFVHF